MFIELGAILFFLMQLVSSNSTDFTTLHIENTQSKNILLTSYLCDDELQKTIHYKINLLETLIENVQLKVDSLNMRKIKQFEELKTAIEGIAKEGKIATVIPVNNNNSTQSNGSYTDSRLDTQDFSSSTNMNSTTNNSTLSSPPSHSPASAITINSNSSSVSSLPSNCQGRQNGTHLIQITNSKLDPFYVYCVEDPHENGAPWMLIQRRRNGNTDFYRNWSEYQRGFGNIEDEFFIGLDKLYALTCSTLHELWIQLENFSNEKRWVKYSSFAIGNANDAYALNVLGSYTGNAGDSLAIHAGQKFSTKDVDNDSLPTANCAVEFTGAWWYNECLTSNLNGLYLSQDSPWSMSGIGIDWQSWPQLCHSLKYVHMAIRPVESSNLLS